MFQSTPVITDGRTAEALAIILVAEVFQSTPVITDGRTETTGLTVPNRVVSIHTRHH